MPPLAAKAAEEGGKQPESGGKSRKTADPTLEKDQKDGIQGPQRIVQWSHFRKIYNTTTTFIRTALESVCIITF